MYLNMEFPPCYIYFYYWAHLLLSVFYLSPAQIQAQEEEKRVEERKKNSNGGERGIGGHGIVM
jgi:hypothetical protein